MNKPITNSLFLICSAEHKLKLFNHNYEKLAYGSTSMYLCKSKHPKANATGHKVTCFSLILPFECEVTRSKASYQALASLQLNWKINVCKWQSRRIFVRKSIKASLPMHSLYFSIEIVAIEK